MDKRLNHQLASWSQKNDLSGLHTRYMNPGELDVLINLVRSAEPASVMEIGTNSGRTAKAILRNVPSIRRYFGIDVPMTYTPARVVQRREVEQGPGRLALDDPRFRLLVARNGSLDLTTDDLPLFDVVFIDGDHGVKAVSHDWALACSLIRRGLVIFHDDHGNDTVDVSIFLDTMWSMGFKVNHIEGTWLSFIEVM